MKKRLDLLMVERALAPSREKAKHILCPEMFMWTDRKKIKREQCSRRR